VAITEGGEGLRGCRYEEWGGRIERCPGWCDGRVERGGEGVGIRGRRVVMGSGEHQGGARQGGNKGRRRGV